MYKVVDMFKVKIAGLMILSFLGVTEVSAGTASATLQMQIINAVTGVSTSLTSHDTAVQQSFSDISQKVSETNQKLTEGNTSLDQIYQVLSGSDVTVNLHKDISQVVSAINNNSKVVTKSLEMSSKTDQFYKEAKLDAVKTTMESEDVVQGDCQSALATDAAKNLTVLKNPSLKAANSVAKNITETRRKTMRNQSVDKKISIKTHGSKFCSATDAAVGLCDEADICQDGDPSCKAGADQSAELFLADGYDNIAHQEGALRYIMNLTDPYPTMKPTKEELLDENKDMNTYRYDTMVKESQNSAGADLLRSLWLDRSNTYNGEGYMHNYLTNINDGDTQTQAVATEVLNRPFKPAGYVSIFDMAAAENENYQAVADESAASVQPVKGSLSALEFLEIQVNSTYGNTSAELASYKNAEEASKTMGRTLALNNKLMLELIKRVDKLIFAEAVTLSRGNK